MSATTEEKIVELVAMSDALVKRANALESEKQAAVEKTAAIIPSAVDALIKAGALHETDRARAIDRLADPYAAMALLAKVAQRLEAVVQAQTKSVDFLGAAATQTKSASASSGTPYYGGKRTAGTNERESDRLFAAGLGVG